MGATEAANSDYVYVPRRYDATGGVLDARNENMRVCVWYATCCQLSSDFDVAALPLSQAHADLPRPPQRTRQEFHCE